MVDNLHAQDISRRGFLGAAGIAGLSLGGAAVGAATVGAVCGFGGITGLSGVAGLDGGAPLGAFGHPGDYARNLPGADLRKSGKGAGQGVSTGSLAQAVAPVETSAPSAEDTAAALEELAPMFSTPQVNTAVDRLAATKRVLIVVDYQVDFVDGGAFGTIQPAVNIHDALYDRIKQYQDAGDIVIYTMDTHPADDYANTREGSVNALHCVPGTVGWEVYGKVAELLTPEKALMIRKGTYGAADLPLVLSALRNQGIHIRSIEFAGVSTTCRVLHNAILVYTYFPEMPLIFDDTTTASYTDEMTAAQLDQLEGWGFVIKRHR